MLECGNQTIDVSHWQPHFFSTM